MLTFIVLGYVPGTHTQLSFDLLLLIVAFLAAPFVIVKLLRRIKMHQRSHQLFLDIVSI
jgi:hypothetical protein